MLEDTYAHTPIRKMFDQGDVYGVGFDEERASRKPLRLGIIGCGGVALSKHIPAIMRLRTLWEPVELAAVCRRNVQAGRHIETMYNVKWYPDYQELIRNEQIDGMLVLSNDQLHYEHAMACLEAGIAVLVEKPITRSLEQSLELCETSRSRNVPLMTVSNKRYSPPYFRARKMILEGPVIDPGLFFGKFNLGYDYVEMLEQGTIHLFDLTRYLMGDVKTVSAVGVNKYHRNKIHYPFDNCTLHMEFESGAVGSICTVSSAVSLKPWERVEIYGNKSWLAVEDQYELLLYDSEEGPCKSWKPVIPNTLIFDEEFGGFMGLIENFLEVIRGKGTPLVTGWDGHKAYELNVATHLSMARQCKISLPLEPKKADHECRKWLNSHQ